MRKVKTDNRDLIQYLKTIIELKNHISIEEYRKEYRRLRSDDVPLIQVQKFKSEHTELYRLEKKRVSLIECFIDKLNPISISKAGTSAKSSDNFELCHERLLFRKALSEKSDDEIIALIIKQRTEAVVEFQRSVEQSLDQLLHISSKLETPIQKCRKIPI